MAAGSRSFLEGFIRAKRPRVGPPYFNEIRRALQVRCAAISAKEADIWQDSIFDDCFASALAKASGEPLLFKGGHFIHTDASALSQRYARVHRREWGKARSTISSADETPAIELKRDRWMEPCLALLPLVSYNLNHEDADRSVARSSDRPN